MRLRGAAAAGAAVAAFACALVLPQAAWAHAALLHTSPQASGTLATSPRQVALTYDEAVAPKFAVISVTDARGRQETTGSPIALPSDPDTIAVPVRHLPEGWYLVYWRVISADGHPVRGAFTFAVGPNPGPAPQFAIPSLTETAATPQLVITRWVVFLSAAARRRPVRDAGGDRAPRGRRARRVPCARSSLALAVSLAVALVAIPVYVLVATAGFAQRPFTDLAATVPVVRDSNLGRSFLDLEVVLVLFAGAAAAVLFVDSGSRRRRSTATLLALIGALLAAASALAVPGPRRTRRPDIARGPLARLRLDAPGRRRDVARRPRGPWDPRHAHGRRRAARGARAGRAALLPRRGGRRCCS